MENTKYSFFHKPSRKDDMPLRLPKLIINNIEIQREEYIKFLGVLLNKHLTRKRQNKLNKNEIAKNIGISYKARPYLNKRATTTLLLIYSLLPKLYKYTVVQF